MSTNRRDFLGQVTTALVGVPFAGDLLAPRFGLATTSSPAPAPDWDLAWVDRIKGKHRAVFDVPEIESGYGVWRATIYVNQYRDVLGVKESDISPVLVLRHNGIVLAMTQAYWDKYGIGAEKKVMHPVTEQPTDRNPALLSSARNELPAAMDPFALDKFIARGNVALACNLAFQDVVNTVKTKDNVSDEEARKRALAMLVPGVIMQPSGVFAALRAQEAGCQYLRAS